MFLAWVVWVSMAWAVPDEIEVWFLTVAPTSSYEQQLLAPKLNGTLVAQACEPVGDYCLDPKIGLYPRNAPKTDSDNTKFAPDEGLPQLPTATSVDRTMVNCDAKYAFDMFCGQAKPETKAVAKADLEVWIDTSSSLRGIDPSDTSGKCQRSAFLEKLLASCKNKRPTIKGFDTSIREITSPVAACPTQGLNDAKRMIEWIEESQAKKLLLITDVYEYQAELAQYLESKRARIRGDRGSFPASQMLDFMSDLAKSCE